MRICVFRVQGDGCFLFLDPHIRLAFLAANKSEMVVRLRILAGLAASHLTSHPQIVNLTERLREFHSGTALGEKRFIDLLRFGLLALTEKRHAQIHEQWDDKIVRHRAQPWPGRFLPPSQSRRDRTTSPWPRALGAGGWWNLWRRVRRPSPAQANTPLLTTRILGHLIRFSVEPQRLD